MNKELEKLSQLELKSKSFIKDNIPYLLKYSKINNFINLAKEIYNSDSIYLINKVNHILNSKHIKKEITNALLSD